MDGKSNIGEVRGVGERQNLEGCMTPIAEEKLNEFPDKDKYLKKVNDMKLLTEIDNKVNKNIELNKEDLRFLYEIDSKIEGFGFSKDPRIKEIKDRRNLKKDLAFIFDCKEENIGTKLSDFDKNEIICFYGDLIYDNKILTDNFRSLQYIMGNAWFRNLISAEGLESLRRIGRNAYFDNLSSAEGLENLQMIGESACFDNLSSAEGLESLQSIGGNAHFDNLTNVKGLKSLQNIGGIAGFFRLTSAKGLENLQNIGGIAIFVSLINADGLESLETINGEDASKFKEEINSRGSKTI